jgi:hypothetical protein
LQCLLPVGGSKRYLDTLPFKQQAKSFKIQFVIFYDSNRHDSFDNFSKLGFSWL